MEIEKVVTKTIKKTVEVPDGIDNISKLYACSRVASIQCDISCEDCALDSSNIIEFLLHVKEQDEA